MATTKPHGTRQRYLQHLKDGEEPCQDCKKANATYQRETQQNNPKLKATADAKKRAVNRAFIRLRRMYPIDYEILYHAELQKEEADDERSTGS